MLAIAMTLLTTTPDAQACAGFYHDPGAEAESNTQRVVFEPVGGAVTVTYEVDLSIDTGAAGWVIPTPGSITEIVDGDGSLVESLLAGTAPLLDFEDVTDQSSGGCGVASKGSDNAMSGGTWSSDEANSVEVLYTGATPTYDFVVLEADSADALQGWLADNGWEDGGAPYASYVADGWQFAAIKLTIDVSSPARTTLPPIQITYDGERMIFPSRMALGSMDTVDTTIFVLGDQRARIASGWSEEPLDLVWEADEHPDYIQYDLFPETIADIGSDRGFAVTYADSWQDGWVTRFETTAPSNVHEEDAEFGLDGGLEPLQTTLSNRSGCDAPEGAAFFLFLPLLGIRRLRR